MLSPKTTLTRTNHKLDGYWNFSLDNDYLTAKKYQHKLVDSELIAVPSSFNNLVLDKVKAEHIGLMIYERQLIVQENSNFKSLYFGAVTHDAKVYINGQFAGEHIGGFLPFAIEIDQFVISGENRITVVVDNRISPHTLPCGYYKHHEVNGYQQDVIDPNFDFLNYTGINRSVYYVEQKQKVINDFVINPKINGEVEYKLDLSTDDSQILVELYDQNHQLVATNTKSAGILKVDDPILWEVRNAYLYTLEIKVLTNQIVIDDYIETIGIREIEIDQDKILLNKKPVYLKGYGKHEDYDLTGRSGSQSDILYDYNLMKWTNANSFRTAHYPHSEEVMEMAKREGFLIINELPAVGININFMPQDFKNHTNTANTYKELHTFDIHMTQLQELYDRDKNNPSVIMWSIANEPRTEEEGAREYFEPLINRMRELDVQNRPITIATEVRSTPDECQVSDLVDVLCINRYYGWYIASGQLRLAEEYFTNELKEWSEKYPNKPMMLTEYGADTIAGMHEIIPTMFTEEFQVEFYKSNHKVIDKFPFICGEQVWSFSDFSVSQNIYRVNGNKKGIFTSNRKPKKAANYLKERWNENEDR